MRRFQYVEPLDKSMQPVYITVTAYWITVMFYPEWFKRMKATFGEDNTVDFSLEAAIEDFMVINWAEEI
jgi:hypothetical protein